jgi:hypothetical protein
MIRTDTDQGRDDLLDFYTHPGPLTTGGRYALLFDAVPGDVAEIVHIVQGVAIHEYMASAYGFQVPEERRAESHLRSVEEMLDRILALDAKSLALRRRPERRLVGVCQHFSSLMVGLLRAKGTPARARYGFGSYFNPGFFEEHTVCEYWNAAESRWVLVDPQFDEVWRARLKIDHNILDVPRDRFLVAGDAWTKYRAGASDPSKFGIFVGEQRGVWFIAGELIRDLAALDKMEMLPWDVWGAMPRPEDSLQENRLAFYDRVAQLTRSPDPAFDELRGLYEADDRLRVPGTVFNALLQRPEPVAIN